MHPGGPFWAKKDEHAWSIPKGEVDDDVDSLGEGTLEATARREFAEETGHEAPDGPYLALPAFSVGSGKKLHAFVVAGDLDAETIVSNTFEMEWPPRSGRTQAFPEVDRGQWFALTEARSKLHKGQGRLVDLLDPILEQTGW